MPNAKYETDDGVVVQIRLSSEKIALAGAAPAGEIEQSGWFVSAAGSTRNRTRRIARAWVYSESIATVGDEGVLVKSYRFPKLTPTAFNAAPPATQSYKGKTLNFVDKKAEG